MAKRTVRDITVEGGKVLLRVDYNVPFTPGAAHIADDSRLQATLPTLRYLLENRAAVVLCSHLGRPGGKVVEELRLKPIAERLESLLGRPVGYVQDCIGPHARQAADRLQPGQVLLLENLRFHPEEERNDSAFARALASLADLYVNDAFAAAHRAHASIEGVPHHLPAVAGFLMERELAMLGQVLHTPKRPLVAILGGAKVGDKIGVLENLLGRVDALLIGGGMAATFLKAQGCRVGASPVEEDRLGFARALFRKAQARGIPLVAPVDVVVASAFAADVPHRMVPVDQVPEGWLILDVGPGTIETFKSRLQRAGTVFWNGPLGVFEFPAFAEGTKALARLLASLKEATTIVGGGSTAEAVHELGLEGAMSHVSTGGGASLEFLDGRVLPGVAALLDKES
ncbi:MAG: phosphoglycerate kinase [Dehalococcoidia bacterium]|nr:phosphoglycerate kinase [Dehalococcoidia bacterium]